MLGFGKSLFSVGNLRKQSFLLWGGGISQVSFFKALKQGNADGRGDDRAVEVESASLFQITPTGFLQKTQGAKTKGLLLQQRERSMDGTWQGGSMKKLGSRLEWKGRLIAC